MNETIRLKPDTLKHLRIRKAHRGDTSYDATIAAMLKQPNLNKGQD